MRERLAARDISYIAMATAMLCVCSWLCIPLTVPVTMQSFGVCLAAALLGLRGGLWTIALYIALGTMGLPVFAGFRGGAGVLLGATGGYIFGFVLTAFVVGFAVKVYGRRTRVLVFSMALGVLLCYVCGSIWFSLVYTQGGLSFPGIVGVYVLPYIIPDALKIALAALLAKRLYPVIHRC